MTMLKDVVLELVSMFVGDAPLAIAILVLVGLAAGLVELAHVPPLVGGAVLLCGCLLILIASVRRASRAKRAN